MGTTRVEAMDIREVRERIARELAARRCNDRPGGVAPQRGKAWTLYGCCGEVNVRAALGLSLGDVADRRARAARLLAHVTPSGWVEGGPSGREHGLCMVLACLHLLGEPIPADLGPLALTEPTALREWLDGLDWSSTHKQFWGAMTPLLASGVVDAAWMEALTGELAARIDPARPLEIWCSADAERAKVISSIYHIASALDAGCVRYPHAELLLDRLLGLGWEDVPDDEHRTDCTDGDWAWLLLRLSEMCPGRREEVIALIHRVSMRRVRQWHERPESVLGLGTFFIYCWLWSTAVFQHVCREHYRGPYIRDTLNDPSLFRLA